jgi:hypothetical protein
MGDQGGDLLQRSVRLKRRKRTLEDASSSSDEILLGPAFSFVPRERIDGQFYVEEVSSGGWYGMTRQNNDKYSSCVYIRQFKVWEKVLTFPRGREIDTLS